MKSTSREFLHGEHILPRVLSRAPSLEKCAKQTVAADCIRHAQFHSDPGRLPLPRSYFSHQSAAHSARSLQTLALKITDLIDMPTRLHAIKASEAATLK